MGMVLGKGREVGGDDEDDDCNDKAGTESA